MISFIAFVSGWKVAIKLWKLNRRRNWAHTHFRAFGKLLFHAGGRNRNQFGCAETSPSLWDDNECSVCYREIPLMPSGANGFSFAKRFQSNRISFTAWLFLYSLQNCVLVVATRFPLKYLTSVADLPRKVLLAGFKHDSSESTRKAERFFISLNAFQDCSSSR